MSSPGTPRWTDPPKGEGRRIGIIAATWHDDIVGKLLDGAYQRLIELGVHENHIDIVRCPGTYELPVIASSMALYGTYDAIIALGVVIRGETAHFEFIAGSTAQALQTVAIDNNLPCVFGVLTVDTVEQAWERTGGVHGHKGTEGAETALRMAAIIEGLSEMEDDV